MSNPSRLVAGVDSSTQSVKIVVRDAATGKLVRQAKSPHPDGTEVDPQQWWSALSDIAPGVLEGVSAISIAAQQHGMVPLDSDNHVVRPAILWNDTRSAQACVQLIDELGGPSEWANAVGSVPVAAFTVGKLRWMAEHEPENAQRTTTVVLPHDYLTWKLLGSGAEFTTDRGDASGTGYWSPATGNTAMIWCTLHSATTLSSLVLLYQPRLSGRLDCSRRIQLPLHPERVTTWVLPSPWVFNRVM